MRITLALLFMLMAQFCEAQLVNCRAFFSNGDDTACAACYTELIEKEKTHNVMYLYSRSYSYYRMTDYTMAMRDIDTIIKYEKEFKEDAFYVQSAYFLKSRIYAKSGNFKDEIKYMKQALRYGETSDIYNNIGYAYINAGKPKESLGYFKKAIKLNAFSDKAYNNRAFAYIKLNKLKEAEADIRTALSINPKNSYIYKHRGMLRIKQNRKEEACEDLEKAKDLGYKAYGNEFDQNEVDQLIAENCKKETK